MTSRQRLDMNHGRQGGRIVPWDTPADVDLARCSSCNRVLLKADLDATHTESVDCRLNQQAMF